MIVTKQKEPLVISLSYPLSRTCFLNITLTNIDFKLKQNCLLVLEAVANAVKPQGGVLSFTRCHYELQQQATEGLDK